MPNIMLSSKVDTPVEVREPEIIVALDLLDRSVVELEEIVNVLINRLSPVVHSEDQSSIEEVKSLTTTILGSRISGNHYRIDMVSSYLRDTINKLEI